MKTVYLNQLQTRYYTGGHGRRDLLFLHGWGSSGRMWLPTMWQFRKHYRMWSLDLPSFGHTESPMRVWDKFEYYTEHVLAFCEEMGIEPYAVIGHSMGARIALDFARRYPRYSERVVVVSPMVTGKLAFKSEILMTGSIGTAVRKLTRSLGGLAVKHLAFDYFAPSYLDKHVIRRNSEDLRRTDWNRAIQNIQSFIETDYAPSLAEIKQPTLIICGERDNVIPPNDSRLAAELIPNSALLMMNGVYHQPMDEAPQFYFDQVGSFLNQ